MAQAFAYNMATPLLAAYLQADDGGGIPWWVWVLLIIVLLLLLLIGFARQPGPGEPLPKPEERVVPPVVAPEPEPVEDIEEAPQAPDDLKRIEGIGPKISSILNENGITTFAALAASDPEHLQKILDDAGIRLAFPETWPKQASLAAAGKWEELGTLQENLKGGRKE
ncbi:MAG: helix-hairpin-helix domain-containing protein [Chloroflexota bacterium]|jgi:predicted flap endonuclease-1-like 5' DNA nuclease